MIVKSPKLSSVTNKLFASEQIKVPESSRTSKVKQSGVEVTQRSAHSKLSATVKVSITEDGESFMNGYGSNSSRKPPVQKKTKTKEKKVVNP